MVGEAVVRACDNHVYIVATNAVRPDAGGSTCFGHSMIVNPIAWRLAQARSGEEIIADRLDMLVYVSGEYWSGGERLARHGFSRRGSGQ